MNSAVRLSFVELPLELAHAWTIARGTSTAKRNGLLRLEAEGAVGYGEAAPNTRYGQSFDGAARAFERLAPRLTELSPWSPRPWIAVAETMVGPESEVTAALDAALWDWRGKRLSKTVAELVGTSGRPSPPTSFSIGIAQPQAMAARARDAREFKILKIKVGLGDDMANVSAVRSATGVPLRVDANEGWKSKEEALERILWLSTQGVELVEQPLPARDIESQRWLFERSPIPLIADESSLTVADVAPLRGQFHGVNVKLSKCGGITRALEMAEAARALGLHCMLGCMIESSLGIAAGVSIAPLFDWVDLDGSLLLADDPFCGIELDGGRWREPSAPGLGVAPRDWAPR
ncbi:MAG: dipeptide epimerase [Planctomycetes bacterium]|nr:dipeptide epimerase [Planctomycetota bacterium]